MANFIKVADVKGIGNVNGWEMDYDNMSGVICWIKGNTRINATPNWEKDGFTPFAIFNEENGVYLNFANFEATQSTIEEQVKAYKNQLTEMMQVLDGFNPKAG